MKTDTIATDNNDHNLKYSLHYKKKHIGTCIFHTETDQSYAETQTSERFEK